MDEDDERRFLTEQLFRLLERLPERDAVLAFGEWARNLRAEAEREAVTPPRQNE